MKKIITALFAVALLAACATTTTSSSTAGQTPAQIAAQICPVATVAIVGLQGDILLPASVLNDLTALAPKVTSACALAGTMTTADLQSLQTLVFNTLLPIAETADPKIYGDLLAVQIVVTAIEAGQAAQAGAASPVTTPAPASPAVPAVAQ